MPLMNGAGETPGLKAGTVQESRILPDAAPCLRPLRRYQVRVGGDPGAGCWSMP